MQGAHSGCGAWKGFSRLVSTRRTPGKPVGGKLAHPLGRPNIQQGRLMGAFALSGGIRRFRESFNHLQTQLNLVLDRREWIYVNS